MLTLRKSPMTKLSQLNLFKVLNEKGIDSEVTFC